MEAEKLDHTEDKAKLMGKLTNNSSVTCVDTKFGMFVSDNLHMIEYILLENNCNNPESDEDIIQNCDLIY